MSFVTLPSNLVKLHFVDYSGIRATSEFNVDPTEVDPEDGAVAEIAAAAQAISADALTLVEILRYAAIDAPVTPTDGPYPRAADKCLLEFIGGDGTTTKMAIPAPQETIFLPDHYYADTADTALAAFIAYVLTNCVTSEGADLLAMRKGYRMRPARRKHQ